MWSDVLILLSLVYSLAVCFVWCLNNVVFSCLCTRWLSVWSVTKCSSHSAASAHSSPTADKSRIIKTRNCSFKPKKYRIGHDNWHVFLNYKYHTQKDIYNKFERNIRELPDPPYVVYENLNDDMTWYYGHYKLILPIIVTKTSVAQMAQIKGPSDRIRTLPSQILVNKPT